MKTKLTSFFVLICVFAFHLSSAQCSFSLANDTIFCTNNSSLNFTIAGPPGYDLYLWSTGERTQDVITDTSGMFTCTASMETSELILNGDFSTGDTLFITDYIYGDTSAGLSESLTYDGTYCITTNPSFVHPNFYSFGDHTTGTGNMLVCNGSEVAGFKVWEQTVPVTPATDYSFSAWVTSLENLTSPTDAAQLQFSINGILIGSVFSPTLTGGDWVNFYENWNSGIATSAVITIVDQNTSGLNDFALDDIFFGQLCSFTDSITVRGVQYPNVDAGLSQIILCHTSTINLTGTSATAGVSYNWTGPGVLSAATSPVVTVGAAGSYVLTATEPANSCQSRDSVTVTLHTLPVISFTTNTIEGCEPTIISFESSTDQPGGSYSWNFGDGTTTSDTSSTPNPTYSYTHDGTYSITFNYSTTSDCVSDTVASSLITIHPHPIAAFDETPKPISISEPTVSFLDQSTGAIDNWLWDFGVYGTSTLQNPVVVYDNIGTYPVKLIVNTSFGCKDSVSKDIQIESIYSLYTPNAFTPDGDGLNDVFSVYGDGIDTDKFEMSIFDRWGERVFTTNDIHKGWNGGRNNTSAICQQDVYVYKIVLADFTGTQHNYIGQVTIVK